jgi:hypothetical protein
MAYERNDPRRGRFHDEDRERARRDERGFFERAGDEVASWFGDEEAERRRREDERMPHGWRRDRDFERERFAARSRFDEGNGPRAMTSRSGYAGYERDFSPRGYGAAGIDRGYAPTYVGGTGYTGGYGYGYGAGNDRGYGSGGFGRFEEGERRDLDRDFERGRSGFAGHGRENDRSYEAWRQRQVNELDRDYDEYRREHEQRFEEDFGTWRQARQNKRGMLTGIREHMDVVGSDGQTIGKVDCVRGDHIVLTKSDSDDNRHHAISCAMIDAVEGDQVRLEVPAEEAKSRWQTLDTDRRESERDANLERSFSGTYR